MKHVSDEEIKDNRNKEIVAINLKETVEIFFVTPDMERMLDRINTHKVIQNQDKQWKAANKWNITIRQRGVYKGVSLGDNK